MIPLPLVTAVLSGAAALLQAVPPADPETRRARIAARLQLQLARLAAKQERWKAQRARREGGGR